MQLVNLSSQSLALKQFIQDQTRFPDTFNAAICDQDEMYLFALANHGTTDRACIRYYFNGHRILDTVRQVLQWHFGELDRISSFLDFASGYGRFTRFLVQDIPPKNVWISDIYAQAVQFQIEQFGVQGIISTTYPQDYPIQQSFDGILACSFFSHLPESTFLTWLQKLYSLLSPQGILMFSVHDRELLPPHFNISTSDILFIPNSESRSLDVNEYGTSYVGESFVAQSLKTISQGEAVYSRIPQGICGYQDLYLVTRTPQNPLSSLKFSHHPQGKIERCELTLEGNLLLTGRLSEINPNGQLDSILVSINGKFIQNGLFAFKPTDSDTQSSWSYQLPLGEISPQDIILIKAINNQELEWVFETTTLENLIQSYTIP
ncbi:class I SAM-dependent methyltransferase [Planktothrix agardhii]|jgi:SAM-dependent methyltransferase|uniref:Methyltransferase type 12 domain-containing protein n=1 Tax=Planktothrix agardhii TaxID=1160 RepID=A0A1J1JCI9_PLAAG|nr:class I SAM-dependent methyltransferase [Planktothrix agardhii]MCF3606669.1 class I SAM-dependent methyltransferase [Planktothrix agardhii 1033]MCB8750865.1 class I SAM-dependent methyltransferase [Planktothrix agardhii 1810]MCB8759608.1 class I SAM-dependent methyltransferase [Planktothrix agardhii 1813]MCB8764639.1 class I SAM-dependent methyltransferase [Planktothrix agardhii 1809]MCB8766321.1 class I SAM-dependent methyltransferase [Planktothrix agardhii 1809]